MLSPRLFHTENVYYIYWKQYILNNIYCKWRRIAQRQTIRLIISSRWVWFLLPSLFAHLASGCHLNGVMTSRLSNVTCRIGDQKVDPAGNTGQMLGKFFYTVIFFFASRDARIKIQQGEGCRIYLNIAYSNGTSKYEW